MERSCQVEIRSGGGPAIVPAVDASGALKDEVEL